MTLYNISENQPPKNEPFLVLIGKHFEIMEWKERIVDGEHKGWYGFYCPCSCCSGYCSTEFKFWMEMPNPPALKGKQADG